MQFGPWVCVPILLFQIDSFIVLVKWRCIFKNQRKKKLSDLLWVNQRREGWHERLVYVHIHDNIGEAEIRDRIRNTQRTTLNPWLIRVKEREKLDDRMRETRRRHFEIFSTTTENTLWRWEEMSSDIIPLGYRHKLWCFLSLWVVPEAY